MYASTLHPSKISTQIATQSLSGNDSARWMLFVLFYAVIANIPFWIASRWLGLLPLGWFCVEYALIGLLAMYVPRILTAALLVTLIAVDMLSAVSKTYYLAPTECLSNLGAMQELSLGRLVAAATVAALTLTIVAISMSLPVARIRGRQRAYAVSSLLAFALVATSADFATVIRETGQMPGLLKFARPIDSNKFSDYKNLWVSRYPSIRLLRNEHLFGANRSMAGVTLGEGLPIPSATAVALHSAGVERGGLSAEMPNVVLVLLESWGVDSDASIRDALVSPYFRPEVAIRYEISQGTVAFHGPTVGGESRELCGSMIGPQIVSVSIEGLRGCVPDRLAALGYHDIALHGMTGHMFRRQTWYRSIGFQEIWFRDTFRLEGLPDCAGAFIGTCDGAVAEWIGRRLEKRDASPDFTYWVTLNSHLPLRVPSGLANADSCSVSLSLAAEPALCSWYQLVANVHESVAWLATGKLGRPTVFVIVGDHAPPFANPGLRSQFSQTDVPYVLLVPRQDNRAAN